MIPLVLNLNNFYSHKESSVDFSTFKSVLLLGNTEGDYTKSNGSGKSAIFEAILWCLFNKSRAAMMDDIVMWGESSCSVELEFKHSEERYKIIRTRNRLNSTSTVEFYKRKEGAWDNISGSTSGITNKRIQDSISLDYKTFVNSVYFRQSDISEFAESDPSKKKEILKNIIDISRWDVYEKSAKSALKDLKLRHDILTEKVSKYDDTVSSLEDSEKEIAEIKDIISKKNKALKSLDKSIEMLRDKYSDLKSSLDTDSYDKVISEIESLRDKESLASDKLKSLSDMLNDYILKKNNVDSEISDKKSESKKILINDLCDSELDRLNSELLSEKSIVNASKEMLSKHSGLDLLPGSCYVCKQDVSDSLYRELKDRHKKQIDDYELKIKVSQSSIYKIESDIKTQKEFSLNKKRKDKVDREIKTLLLESKILNDKVLSIKKDISTCEDSLSSIRKSMEINKIALKSLKNDDFDKIKTKIKKMISERLSERESIGSGNKKIGVLTEKISSYEESIKEMKSHKKSINSILKEIMVYEKVVKFFGKNGIQTILLDAIIDDLERESNIILSSICNEPASIILDTQRVGADGSSLIETLDLKIRKDGAIQNFKSLSGGEQFRISLSLRIALSEVAGKHGGTDLEFLLLDEINSPLDRHGVDSLFVNIINSLSEKYKIMVITHDDLLKEKFDDIIDVTKINGESSIKFISR